MKGLNLSKFKKVSEGQGVSVLQHEDGHQLKIMHQALPMLQRKQLEKLPIHLAEGGDSDQEPDDQASLHSQQNVADVPTDNSNVAVPEYLTPNSVDEAPQVASDQASLAALPATQQQSPTVAQSPIDLNASYQKGQNAIGEQQQVEAKQSEANAQTEQSDIQARQDLINGFKQNSQDFQNQQKAFLNDYANNKIDPKHYQENQTSGQKVATAIGLFLGGFSTPFTHQGNPALDFLNKQIDRDIAGQEMRSNQQKTLLGANQELYHDNLLAQNATRMQLNDIYSHQLQLNAAKLGTPQAKAKADAASSQFALTNQKLLQENATRATVLHSLNSNGGQGLDAIDLGHAGIIDSKTAEEEQKSVDAQKTAVQAAKSIFTQYDKEQKTSNLANPESARRVGALNSELINTVMNASASKRLNEAAVSHELEPLMVKTTDDQQTRQTKLDSVLNAIGKHADPTPNVTKYAPGLLPRYPFQGPQYKAGQQILVQGKPAQIIDNKGNYKFVGK